MRGNSRVVDAPSVRGADCGIDYCLVRENFRERLSVRKRATEKLKVKILRN